MYLIGDVEIDVSEEEYHRYLSLAHELNGTSYFHNLFKVDDEGCITSIDASKSMPWVVLFFAQQMMINQRLRFADVALNEIKSIREELLGIRKMLEEK